MKIKERVLDLVELGFSTKFISKLNESEISILHNKLIGEAITTSTTTSYNVSTDDVKKGVTLPPTPPGKKMTIQQTPTGIKATPTEEVTEDDDEDLIQQDLTQKVSGQLPPEDQSDEDDDGMDDDTSPKNKNLSSVGMTEGKKMKSKKKKNPWAICTAQLGSEFGTQERHLWNAKQKNKYERCVKDVKKSLKEGKNPVTLFIENKIMKLVESHIPPRITKKDLISYLTESEPKVAPKPGVKEPKPDTKTPPKIKPGHPGKNPNPKVNPAPKAKSPEEAKSAVIDAIIKILKNG
jgi:hypothetical protein